MMKIYYATVKDIKKKKQSPCYMLTRDVSFASKLHESHIIINNYTKLKYTSLIAQLRATSHAHENAPYK